MGNSESNFKTLNETGTSNSVEISQKKQDPPKLEPWIPEESKINQSKPVIPINTTPAQPITPPKDRMETLVENLNTLKADSQKMTELVALIRSNMSTELFKKDFTMQDGNNVANWQLFYILSSCRSDITNALLIEYIDSKFYDPPNIPILQAFPGFDNYDNYLINALRNKNAAVAKAIIAKGNYNPAYVNGYGDTALIYACYNNLPDIALMLLEEKDCAASALNRKNESAYYWADHHKMYDVCKKIILLNVNDNYLCNGKYMPGMYALLFHHCNVEAMTCVANKLYDPSKDKVTDTTVLIKALNNFEKELALKIIELGNYRPSVVDHWNDTALTYACHRKYVDVALKLIDDAQPFPINKDNESALSLAIIHDMEAIADKTIDRIEYARTSLVLKDDDYEKYINLALAVAWKINSVKYMNKLFKTFSYKQTDILEYYKKSNKEMRKVIMDNYELDNSAFLIEKYGIDKLQETSFVHVTKEKLEEKVEKVEEKEKSA